ncbi:MAG: hypothetical protein V1870_04755 [Candidatus Aenigmatarchaeota archaeon]
MSRFDDEIFVAKKYKAMEFFGLLSDWKISTQKLKDEARRGW